MDRITLSLIIPLALFKVKWNDCCDEKSEARNMCGFKKIFSFLSFSFVQTDCCVWCCCLSASSRDSSSIIKSFSKEVVRELILRLCLKVFAQSVQCRPASDGWMRRKDATGRPSCERWKEKTAWKRATYTAHNDNAHKRIFSGEATKGEIKWDLLLLKSSSGLVKISSWMGIFFYCRRIKLLKSQTVI